MANPGLMTNGITHANGKIYGHIIPGEDEYAIDGHGGAGSILLSTTNSSDVSGGVGVGLSMGHGAPSYEVLRPAPQQSHCFMMTTNMTPTPPPMMNSRVGGVGIHGCGGTMGGKPGNMVNHAYTSIGKNSSYSEGGSSERGHSGQLFHKIFRQCFKKAQKFEEPERELHLIKIFLSTYTVDGRITGHQNGVPPTLKPQIFFSFHVMRMLYISK